MPAAARLRILILTLSCFCFSPAGAGETEGNGTPTLFQQHCTSCHGADGRARTPAARKLRVKDLTLSNLTDKAIRIQILEGSRNESGKSKMPSFKDKLTAEEIEALIDQVKAFRLQTS